MTPRDPFEKLQRDVEQLFHGLVYHHHPAAHFSDTCWAPAADLVVSKHAARVLVELAGVPREAVQVRLNGPVLEISGRRQPPHEPSGAHYHRAEIFFGDFRRVIELPWDADPDGVAATYKEGMLEIRLKPLQRRHVDVAVETHGVAPVASPEKER